MEIEMPAWSGLYDGVHKEQHSLIGKPQVGFRLRRALKGVSASKYRELVKTLVDGAVGDTASASHTRLVAGTPGDNSTNGGVRQIETIVDVNRATTSADQAQINSDLLNDHTPTFPVEKSGNSGGGKQGF